VSPDTRLRVLQAAQALGYVIKESGRSLVTHRSRRIGIVAARLGSPFYPALVEPLHRALTAGGYRTVLFTDEDEVPLEVENLLDGSLDGVILSTCELTSEVPGELSRRAVPYVLVNRSLDETPGGDVCVIDNYFGAALAAGMLAELGHRQVGAIFGPQSTSTGRDRERGFRDKLNELGIPLCALAVRHGPFHYDTGYQGITDLLASEALPTAVFCSNDAMALGALNAATVLNLAVPDELSIVGFDDLPMAGWPLINMTTVATDLAEMAEVGARLLLERIDNPHRPSRRVEIPPSMARRGSHSKPRSSAVTPGRREPRRADGVVG